MGIASWIKGLLTGDIPGGGTSLLVSFTDPTVPQAPANWIHVHGGIGATAEIIDAGGNDTVLTVTAAVEIWAGLEIHKIKACSVSVTLGTGSGPVVNVGGAINTLGAQLPATLGAKTAALSLSVTPSTDGSGLLATAVKQDALLAALKSADTGAAVDLSSADVTVSPASRAVYVGGGGDLKVDFATGGTGIILSAVPTGTQLDISVVKIYKILTTATLITVLK